MKVFLDTSLLSDARLSEFGGEILDQIEAGSSFYVSSLTHFQLMWGYALAGMSPSSYQAFLRKTGTEVAPLTKADAELAAEMKPGRADLLDALIAATAKRYDATVWTLGRDFLRLMPETRVRVLGSDGER